MDIGIKSLDLPYRSYEIYDVTFFGDTVKTLVTKTPCIVATWISDMESLYPHRLPHLIVGLDIEWRPNSVRGATPNPTATLQLCVGRNCLIFQILHADEVPQTLLEFLNNRDYTFVGVGIKADVEKLRVDYGLRVGNAVDLRELAEARYGCREFRSPGLVMLAKEVLGKEFQKPKMVSRSDWADEWLSEEQIQYACVDAYVSFEIGRCLRASVNI